jgi:chromosome segregation ATPase
MNIEDITNRIADLEKGIADLEKEKHELEQRLRKLKSLRFIEVNNITKQNTFTTDIQPIFWYITELCEFLRDLEEPLLWACWNGVIHHTTNLITDKFLPTDGLESDIPGTEE